ncbi:hypothetical protein RDV64_23230 (plasmid) [Acuticoccus sp. MNP-M23]|uniref:hypothetical protein n=1 Tax=Acuticoccus sp. MNP-M23 TaxID=3072793 RepID=UPI00281633CD|nr:hypothetical protein [Acuticoccus sp. MNP-M23]WMS45248.1 hypothetical protein RDV64_23230 [Acuticoccus sp. MNP-M23]
MLAQGIRPRKSPPLKARRADFDNKISSKTYRYKKGPRENSSFGTGSVSVANTLDADDVGLAAGAPALGADVAAVDPLRSSVGGKGRAEGEGPETDGGGCALVEVAAPVTAMWAAVAIAAAADLVDGTGAGLDLGALQGAEWSRLSGGRRCDGCCRNRNCSGSSDNGFLKFMVVSIQVLAIFVSGSGPLPMH